MKISLLSSPTFGRRLKPSEEADYCTVLKRGKELAGNTGNSILIVPSPSLPQGRDINTGVGNLLDKDALDFFDFAKKYWGINCIQDLPNGRYIPYNGYWRLYSGSSMDLGSQNINLELLTKDLISKEDLKFVVSQNFFQDKVNFENVLNQDSPMEKVLKKAYNSLLKADTEPKRAMLKELEVFNIENKSWLEPKSIFQALKNQYGTENFRVWSETDKNLYNPEKVSLDIRDKRISEIAKNHSFDIDYYKFKQYLADKHLKLAKSELNKRGIKLSGDFICGFSWDELWMRPKAFLDDTRMKWGFPAPDLNSEEGISLLKEKASLYAKRYDALRVDAAWTYVNQPIESVGSKKIYMKNYYGEKGLNAIEDAIKSVKGKDYNPENIMYEFIAALEDFRAIDSNGMTNPLMQNRNKIYSANDLSYHWGSTQSFKNYGWSKTLYTLGTANHDQIPMKIDFASSAKREAQAEVLSTLLKIPKEKLSDLKSFIKAKFAEPMRARNNFIFFVDALNLDGRYKDNTDRTKDYRLKIRSDYQDIYFKALENGEGYNPMDALEKAFKAEGLDKKEPELYKKIVKYKKILEEPQKNILIKRILTGSAAALAICFVTLAAVKYHSHQKEKPAEKQPA